VSSLGHPIDAAGPRLRTRSAHEIASIFRIGDRYASYDDPSVSGGRAVAFVVRLDVEPRWRSPEDVVVFPQRGVVDARLSELRAVLSRTALHGCEIDASLGAFAATHADLERSDPLAQARLAIHHDFDKALYMRHFAEIAGVHEATFTRRFAARFGTTPTRYRMVVRLSEAALLLATCSRMTVREIAARVGFEDVPYFHRAFASQFGLTPLALGRSLSEPPPPRMEATRSTIGRATPRG
jgi:AraC-like DNA-binding protein